MKIYKEWVNTRDEEGRGRGRKRVFGRYPTYCFVCFLLMGCTHSLKRNMQSRVTCQIEFVILPYLCTLLRHFKVLLSINSTSDNILSILKHSYRSFSIVSFQVCVIASSLLFNEKATHSVPNVCRGMQFTFTLIIHINIWFVWKPNRASVEKNEHLNIWNATSNGMNDDSVKLTA